jgi:hypothetical protein
MRETLARVVDLAKVCGENRKVICRCFYGYFRLIAARLSIGPAAVPE